MGEANRRGTRAERLEIVAARQADAAREQEIKQKEKRARALATLAKCEETWREWYPYSTKTDATVAEFKQSLVMLKRCHDLFKHAASAIPEYEVPTDIQLNIATMHERAAEAREARRSANSSVQALSSGIIAMAARSAGITSALVGDLRSMERDREVTHQCEGLPLIIKGDARNNPQAIHEAVLIAQSQSENLPVYVKPYTASPGAAMNMSERLDQPFKPDKGLWNGSCNRQACQAPGAVWWNRGTHHYYCAPCARMINDSPGHRGGELARVLTAAEMAAGDTLCILHGEADHVTVASHNTPGASAYR